MKDDLFSPSRRRFIQQAASAAIAAPFILRTPAGRSLLNGKLNHACIGVGGMQGMYDLQNFMKHPAVQIVALCDVDAGNLQKAAALLPGARLYSDWRELLASEADKIDSVNVTVPDHNHFPIAFSAIKAGKHVYCQKPMCHDVAEVRALTEASVSAGVVTQLGTQVASGIGDQTAVQLLKDGAIGKITHAYLCSNRPGAVETYRLAGPRPAQGEKPPAGLSWDLWIGSAPMRPYVPKIYHPIIWRAWQDFGTGWSGDIGCHIFDYIWKGLGLKAPLSVTAEVQGSWKESPSRRADTWPQAEHITWIFPGNERIEPEELTIEWFDGDYYFPKEIREMLPDKKIPPESSVLTGTEGALLMPHNGMPVLLPAEKYVNYSFPKKEAGNHYHLFVDACLGGEKTASHFAQTGPMTETILLGTVAIRVPDKILKWDPAGLNFPDAPEAGKYLRRTYRDGWKPEGAW